MSFYSSELNIDREIFPIEREELKKRVSYGFEIVYLVLELTVLVRERLVEALEGLGFVVENRFRTKSVHARGRRLGRSSSTSSSSVG